MMIFVKIRINEIDMIKERNFNYFKIVITF